MKIKIGEKLQYITTLVMTLLAMGLIVYYTFGSFYSIAKEDAVTLGETTVKERAETMNNFLLKGKELMYSTTQNIDFMLQNGDTEQEILKFLEYTSDCYAYRMSKSFTGVYGVVNDVYLDGIGWLPEEDYIPQERLWYTDAIKGRGEPVIGTPYIDALTGEVIISVSQMLSNKKDVVSMDIVMNEMQVLAEDIQLNGNGYGFIIDQNGFIAAHQDKGQRGKNYLTDEEFAETDLQKMVEKIVNGKLQSFHMDINGEECVIFTQVVESNWYTVMVINSQELFEKVQQNLFRNIIISFLIFGLVAYFCTASYFNKNKAQQYAQELREYQLTLEEKVFEQTKEIKQQATEMIKMQEGVIEGMATLIESRDMNTGEHVKNTKKYVEMIANYMYERELHPDEVNAEYVDNITNSASLHDIGKIKISDLILNKPGRLTREEFEIMKTHSVIGSEMVQTVLGEHADEKLLQISIDMAKYHHEKWNGTGYPEGLKGIEIPLSARIMAVADVFDALISKRVYKDAMAVDDAFAILEKDAGTHFDPEVVEIFFKFREEIKQYLEH